MASCKTHMQTHTHTHTHTQLEADVTAIKSEKVQVHNLMTQVKMMHEEDNKRFAEDLARVNRDCERKVPPPHTRTSSPFLTSPTRVVYPCRANLLTEERC